MSRTGSPQLRKSAQKYLWNIMTVATFYALPVIQLVITYQRVLNNTGNQVNCSYIVQRIQRIILNDILGFVFLQFLVLTSRVRAVRLQPRVFQHWLWAVGIAFFDAGLQKRETAPSRSGT
jgi:hypothetical protein